MSDVTVFRSQSVRVRFWSGFMSLLGLTGSLVVGAGQAKPHLARPVPLVLPGDREVTWYQWEDSDQIFLRYTQRGFPRFYTGKFDLHNFKFTPFGVPNRYFDSMDAVGATEWQVSPDHKWLKGPEIILGLGSSQWTESTSFGSGMRWAPDSRSWIEWKNTNENVVVRQAAFANDQKNDRSPQTEYTLPRETRILGFTAPKTALFVSMEDTFHREDYLRSDWTAQSLSFDIPHPQHHPWKLQIPHLMGIDEGAISADLKEVCWLAFCYQGEPKKESRKDPAQDKVLAVLWTSDVNGNHQKQIAAFPLADTSVDQYKTPESPVLYDLPHNLQWIPGKHKVSYLWEAKIWTVEIP